MTGVDSLGEMFVVENVIGAEAVVARTAGTVTEFKIRIARVSTAADGTLVAISTLGFFFLLLPNGGFELNRLVTGLVAGAVSAPGQFRCDGIPEEHEEVQQSHDRHQCEQGIGKQIAEYRNGENSGVQPGQPLDFNRDKEEQEKLRIRIQHGKSEEHGHIHIVSTGNGKVGAEHQTGNDAHQQS